MFRNCTINNISILKMLPIAKKKGEEEVKKQESTNSNFNIYMVLGSRFEVDKRYEIIDPVGSGAYGVVVAAKDLEAEDQENNLVAIKKIEKAFEHKVFA
jgi:serine/threonine protein kinase